MVITTFARLSQGGPKAQQLLQVRSGEGAAARIETAWQVGPGVCGSPCIKKPGRRLWDRLPLKHLGHFSSLLQLLSQLSQSLTTPHAAPPTRQVHWLRIILDEGHTLGASLAITNKRAVACELRTERRWAMTGAQAAGLRGRATVLLAACFRLWDALARTNFTTDIMLFQPNISAGAGSRAVHLPTAVPAPASLWPMPRPSHCHHPHHLYSMTHAGTPTPTTGAGSGAAHLQPLLQFLRQQPYGTSRAAWEAGVQRPLEARCPWGRAQLMALLRRCMIRCVGARG